MAARTTKGKKVTCDVCGKPFVIGYIGTHKRKQHGIAGGRSGKARRRNGTQPAFSGLKHVEDMILLQDDEGNMWIAERIR
jgi:hypothetical protein